MPTLRRAWETRWSVLSAENLASIESEGLRLLEALRTDPVREVPQYPGWTMADLASHTASIHGRTVLVCRQLPQERISAPRLPEGRDPIDWYEETLYEMIEVLTESDPRTPVWTFTTDPDEMWVWERRMVVETGIHRWDAFQALDRVERLSDRVAEQGLEEFPTMWLPHLGEVPTLEVMATDLGRSWVYGDGAAVATVSGTASDVYLRLVSRPSPVQLPESWAEAVDGLAPPPRR